MGNKNYSRNVILELAAIALFAVPGILLQYSFSHLPYHRNGDR